MTIKELRSMSTETAQLLADDYLNLAKAFSKKAYQATDDKYNDYISMSNYYFDTAFKIRQFIAKEDI